MTNVTAEMAKKTEQTTAARTISAQNAAPSTDLDHCYRQIGISAVAAAVRYQGVAKNPAYAPVTTNWRDHEEAA
jgi:hypothetical protein